VVVLGAGIAGSFALMTALQLGALVQVFDINEHRLAALKLEYPALRTAPATAQGIAAACVSADLVVGAVMLAGRRAPKVVRADTVAAMREGSVIIDIAIDQGGCVENIRPTSAEELVYRHQGVLHSAVPNMPGAVPRTASQSLSAAIAPYVAELAGGGLAQSVRLLAAVALRDHAVVDPVLQQELA
jgi:alanine dehydrogenase